MNWNDIHTVLLDMDGTLLDLHFDNHFWLDLVPRRYAEHKGLPPEVAKEEFIAICKRIEGTLDWYCLDYWTATLGLDIPLLKEEVAHLIAEHPHVIEFLQALHAAGKRRILVTNAHQKSLELKLRHTRIGTHFERMFSAHEFGMPKEEPAFWQRLRDVAPFDPRHTLLIDDSLPVLRSAQQYGIAHLRAVRCPDTQQAPRYSDEFEFVERFADIMP
jgi:putative hydrolase of the HAD superfamily